MKPGETRCNASRPSRPCARYLPVFDGRKRRIRGLWERNGQFVARPTTETPDGRKKLVWHVIEKAQSVADARQAMADLDVERRQGRLLARGEAPHFAEFLDRYFAVPLNQKRAATLAKERTQLGWWKDRLGALRLDQIQRSHVVAGLEELQKSKLAPQTRNLHAISLRSVFKYAVGPGRIAESPAGGLSGLKPTSRKREHVGAEAFERLITPAASGCFVHRRLAMPNEQGLPLKNAEQFGDYLRFLLYTGAREKEALRVRRVDVDFEQQLVTIGADGLAKNAEVRHVDFNPALARHLQAMHRRKAPDSEWLFPFPQRGERDAHAQTFRETLKLARAAVGLPRVGFRDTRHDFISRAVMAGIDFMTIARWVGHNDGGVLIDKVYGHIASEHRKKMAARLKLGDHPVSAFLDPSSDGHSDSSH